MGLRLPPEFERFGPWDKLPGIPDDGGLDMVNRSRNDNVSGRVPLSAGRATDEQVETAIPVLVRLVREKNWAHARELLDTLEAGRRQGLPAKP